MVMNTKHVYKMHGVIFCRIFKGMRLYLKYLYNINRCKTLSFFEVEQLVKPFDVFYWRTYPFNKFYGINIAVKKKLNKSILPLNVVIEHGVYFGDNVSSSELEYYKSPVVYTMGWYREKLLRSHGYNAFAIGPYILNVPSFLSEKTRKRLKERMGKILLVFPSHSIEGVYSEYDVSLFDRKIKEMSVEYDTVLICMYWKDIIEKRNLAYEKSGYTIVTAGHRSDPAFLSRLKDLILLSDMTISNNIGTHIGYSICLNRPHFLFSQEVDYQGENVMKEQKDINWDAYSLTLKEFQIVFGRSDANITQEQLQLVYKYWGYF